MECINPLILENIIKEKFNIKFTLIAGREYFEGNESDILIEFIENVMGYKKTEGNINTNNYDGNDDNINENNSDDNSDSDDNINENNSNSNDGCNNINDIREISEIFVNYNDDEEFGGNKQLIKIIITDYDYIIVKFIYDKCIEKMDINIKFEQYSENYIRQLIINNIITNDGIYDLNDVNFLNKLKKYKKKINVYNSIDITQIEIRFREKMNSIFNDIKFMLFSNTIINNVIYCDIYNFSNNNCLSININLIDTINNNQNIKIFKMNKMYFSDDYLRQYIPYCIDYNNCNYIIINRDYKCIGVDTNSIHPNLGDHKKREYLFDDGCKPWCDDEKCRIINLKNIVKKYNAIILNKKCFNSNDETTKILSHMRSIAN